MSFCVDRGRPVATNNNNFKEVPIIFILKNLFLWTIFRINDIVILLYEYENCSFDYPYRLMKSQWGKCIVCGEENIVKVICIKRTALTIGLFENSSEDYGINSGWQHLRFRHQKHLHCLIVDKPKLDIRVLALRFVLCLCFLNIYLFV